MSVQRKSTRQRLVQSALQLFAAQGVTETTTRQIAELAGVNEVTLFRNFGSKQGLLLAVIEEAEVFTQLGDLLSQHAEEGLGFDAALQAFADNYLKALEQVPEFLRSLVGESGRYPVENRQAIGRGLNQVHRYTVGYLTTVVTQERRSLNLPTEAVASLLNIALLGYALMEFTTEFHQLWPDREAFLADLVQLFLFAAAEGGAADGAAVTPSIRGSRLTLPAIANETVAEVADLPAPLVRAILSQARKSGLQDYALAYVLFGAGLSPQEMSLLERSHSLRDTRQHLLHIPAGRIRQVPLNQWIMGQRYGSYLKNPLTQWLKSRKDDHPALFLNEANQPMTAAEMGDRWQVITADLQTPSGQPPTLDQAHQTWCVEMLMRGISLENLSLLTDTPIEQLQPYAHRAREKAALEQAIQLDQRPSH
ncbi:MAG: TetR family transcriptional regulator [Synechococcales bacterium]|nr:TetR family transcriptional regulator [Synechococcales bacterium]